MANALADPERFMESGSRGGPEAWSLPGGQNSASGLQQAQAHDASRRATPVTMAPARFVELTPSEGIAVAECVVELEGPRGKMRMHWKGAMPPDLAGLSRVLWESA